MRHEMKSIYKDKLEALLKAQGVKNHKELVEMPLPFIKDYGDKVAELTKHLRDCYNQCTCRGDFNIFTDKIKTGEKTNEKDNSYN